MMDGETPPRRGQRAPILSDALEAPEIERPTVGARTTRGKAGGETGEALAALRRLGAAVPALGAALELSPEALAAAEAFDRLEIETSMSVERVAELDGAALREWWRLFGADFELDVALAGLDPSFDPVEAELRAGRDPLGTLEDFREAALDVASTQGESVSVTARLRIGKAGAARQLERILAARASGRAEGMTAPVAGIVFYSAGALRRLLALNVAQQWRERGLGGEERRVVVGLCDSAGYLAGVALEVIGAAGPIPPIWQAISPQAWRRFGRRVAQARKLRDAESVWSGAAVGFMPDHLRVRPLVGGLESIAARLAELRAEVAACALASHIEPGDRRASATLRFAGPRPAALRLSLSGARASQTSQADQAEASQPEAPGAVSADGNEVDALVALADWAYRDASPDRLAIAREALATELPAASEITLAGLRAAAPQALATAHANLALYLKGATARYFQLRGAAQEAITSYAESTRKAVTDLTNDVVDNAFKTVGLIVGVVIAGLIQPSVSRGVAALSATLYIAYIVFIMWYLLRARYARYGLERKALDTTLDAMRELSENERERLRAPALQADTHFERYYHLTWRIYLALAILGGVALLLIWTPAWGLITPHPVAAPTPTQVP